MSSEKVDSFDFYEPQRQSVIGIIVLFADAVQKFIRHAWVFILLIIFKFDSDKWWVYLLCFLGLLIVFLVYAYLVYRNFIFYIDTKKEEFVVKKGVFRKEYLSIPIQKIQQVNINQTLIQKLIRVYSLGIETAGSNEKEVDIRAISHEQALAIKERLLDHGSSDVFENSIDTNKSISHDTKPFIKLSFLTLLKIGLVSNYGRSIALLIGFLGTMYNGLHDVITSFQLDENEINSTLEQGFALVSVGIIIGFLIVAVLLINIFSTIFKHYQFEISKHRKLLSISSGLLSKKNKIINPQKTQIITYSQNFFQRKMNFYDMFIKQASSVEVSPNQQDLSVEVPGCSKEERDQILDILLNKQPVLDGFYVKNYRFFLRVLFSGMLMPIAIYIIFALKITPEIRTYEAFVYLYALLLGIYSYFSYKNARLYVTKDFVVVRSGAWDVSNEILQNYKIQGITLKQPFWYQKADVGHVILHTAAGDLIFNFAQYSQIQNHVNQWLFEVEISNKEWM
jgi:putative membrane protein